MKIFSILILFSAITVYSESLINEDELFSDTSLTLDSSQFANQNNFQLDSSRVAFSGEVNSYFLSSSNRGAFRELSKDSVNFNVGSYSNLLLDVRLPLQIKSFGNFEISFNPDSQTNFYVKELFVDYNFKQRLYLRYGKQVLQWGRCNVWNPVDFVNIEKKRFFQKFSAQEGSYGLRLHLPYKTFVNAYSFLDFNNPSTVDSIALSLKLEFLIRKTEIALSYWDKSNKRAFWGLDFSTGFKGIDFTGEIGITSGKNYIRPNFINGKVIPDDFGDDYFVRACFGASKAFDLLNVSDRVSLSGEFYFNQLGYPDSIFDILGKKEMKSALIEQLRNQNFQVDSTTQNQYNSLPYGNPRILLGFYEPNNFSRYYAAFTCSISKFIISDMTFTTKSIINLSQGSATISTGLLYRNLHNFYSGVNILAYVGPQNTEYTFFDNALDVQMYFGLLF